MRAVAMNGGPPGKPGYHGPHLHAYLALPCGAGYASVSRPCPTRVNGGSLWIGLFFLLGGVLGASPAWAHHIQSLPHYSYKSGYREAPVYEEVKRVDGYLVTFTYYRIPGQKALDLGISIRDGSDGKPFAAPVTFRVFGKHEDPSETHLFTAHRNPANTYRIGWFYENNGAYYVRVSFKDSTGVHRALFELSVGRRRGGWYLIAGAVILVAVLAAIAGLVRRGSRGASRG